MIDITAVNISAVNLNLFVAFDALHTERNVTRAAKRIGVTQSALSNSLSRLRVLFGDPLFLRGPRGITPTPRALELALPIQRGLASFGAALSPATFDPKTAERTFVIATSDYVQYVLLPPLLKRMADEAPHVRIDVRPWGLHEVPPSLAQGEADLMIGFYTANALPAQHRDQDLFTEEYACIVRAKHPEIGARPSLATWARTPHVIVSERPTGPGSVASVDRALAKKKLARAIGIRVTHFLLVPEIVAKTDFVAALSSRVAKPYTRLLPLRTFTPPIKLPPSTIGQVWHERLHGDPGHRWLRELVADVSARV